MNMTNLALEIAIKAHEGQIDLGGNAYIEHPKAVARMLTTDVEKAVAYLHDVLEDTSVTEKDLLNMGISKEIVDIVKILTKKKTESYKEYIESVKVHPIARNVKIADITHNMDMSRISNPSKRDIKRLEKYKKALLHLQSE